MDIRNPVSGSSLQPLIDRLAVKIGARKIELHHVRIVEGVYVDDGILSSVDFADCEGHSATSSAYEELGCGSAESISTHLILVGNNRLEPGVLVRCIGGTARSTKGTAARPSRN